MSGKVSGWVWDQELPMNEKYVLLAYADHADHDGNNVFPSLGLIARKTSYDKRTIRRITRKLEERGFLIPVGDQKGGRHRSNRWHIPIYGGEKADTHAPLSEERRTNDAKRRTLESEKADTAMSAEPSLTVKEPRARKSKNKPTRLKEVLYGFFDGSTSR